MQKLQKDELIGFANEYHLTVAAQDGDGKAWLALWKHYKPMMMSRLLACKGLTRQELESEAIEVFSYKLSKFDRDKVKSEEAFSMFSWLFCAVVNHTNKLIRRRKREVHLYFENVSSGKGSTCPDAMKNDFSFFEENDVESLENPDQGLFKKAFDNDVFNVYSPEKLVVEKLQDDDSDRIREFYSKLSQFQKDILEARREEMTLAQVANKFKCSVTTIKNHINKAKQCWGDVFQVEVRKFSYA